MRTLIFCCCTALALILLHGCSAGPSFVRRFPPTHPDTLARLQIDVASYEQRFGDDYASVYLLWEQNQEIRDQGIFFIRTTQKHRYLVLDPTKEWLSQFRLTLERKESLDQAAVCIRYPDGTVQQYREQDMRTEKGSEYTAYKLAYPNITRGTVIEEWYTTVREHAEGYTPDSHEKELQFSIPADSVVYRFISPLAIDVQVRQRNPDFLTPHRIYTDSTYWMNVLDYHKTNVPAVHDEPYSPYNNDYRDRLDFRLRAIYRVFSNKAVQSWEEFADEYTVLLESSITYRYWDLVDSLTASCTSDIEKLRAVVAYIQQEYESDRNAPYWIVRNQKRGNPTELVCFAQHLLTVVDIDAELVFIQPEQEGHFDPTFYSGYQFYIPALYTEIDGRPVFSFPYRPYTPVGFIPDDLRNRPAIRITEDGFNGLVQTPGGNELDNTTDERYVLTIEADGAATVEEERIYRGRSAAELREQLCTLKVHERERRLRDMATYNDGDTRFLSHEVVNLTTIDSALTIRLRYKVDNLVAFAHGEAVLQTAGLFAPQSAVIDPTVPKRHNPVCIRSPWTWNREMTIRYPDGWRIHSVPTDSEVKNFFGSVHSTFTSHPGVVTARLRQSVQKVTGTREQYRELLNIVGDLARPFVPPLVFSTTGS